MTYYAGRETGPPTGLIFTMPLKHEALRKDCYLKDGVYYSVLKWKGNLIALGDFDGAEKCNLVWDRERLIRRRALLLSQSQGFCRSSLCSSIRVNVMIEGVVTYFRSFTKEQEKEALVLYTKEYNKETARQLDALN